MQRADWLQILKYCVHNVAHAYGKTATFMPKPIVGDNGSGMHVHQSIWKDGKNLFAGDGYAGLSDFALYYIGGIIKHAKALNAITNPGTNSLQAPGAGLRSAGQARVLGAQSLGVDPHSVRVEPEGPPHRSALPGSDGESVPRLLGDADGGPRRHSEQDPPGRSDGQEPVRPRPEEAAKIPHRARRSTRRSTTSTSDREFLTRGGVFTDDMIDAYIALKMEEVTRFRMTTHPVEFEMYYSL